MLTDYHVHLRPDTPDTPSERHFTAANADRYRTVATERGIAELGVSEHVYRFTQALDVWDHELWRESARDDLDAYCGFVREETDLRLGIEADFVPGREDRMAGLLEDRPVGLRPGLHPLPRDRALDYDRFDVWTRAESADKVWRTYFTWLGEAAGSGLFDILAHPDLVKHWGSERPWPEKDLRYYYELAMEPIAASGSPWRCPRPACASPSARSTPPGRSSRWWWTRATPSRSARTPTPSDQLGHGYEQALELLDQVGVTELAVFEERRVRLEPIG
jgi:histidinol-phosphatase (PHP family)